MRDSLLPLFEAFSEKCLQIQHAIRSGDDQLVRLLDSEMEPLISAVVDHHADTPADIHRQLRFVSSLIRADADDHSCVQRHAAMLSTLLDRYYGNESGGVGEFAGMVESSSAGGDAVLLNDVILDGLPDSVAVVTRDCHYLYANKAYAAGLGLARIDLIGAHISQHLGAEPDGLARVTEALEKAFDGMAHQDLAWPGCQRARVSALYARKTVLIGALIVLRERHGTHSA